MFALCRRATDSGEIRDGSVIVIVKCTVYTFIVAPGKKTQGGGGGAIRNPKKMQV